VSADLRAHSGSKVYLKEDEINQAVVPHGTLQSISTWLVETRS
jgi:hypothetical protein